jgi:hypothetical protein
VTGRAAELTVEPRPLAGRRSRGPIVAGLVVIGFLSAAVVKPWEGPETANTATRLGSTEAAARASPVPASPPRRVGLAQAADPAPEPGDDLRAATSPRTAWGIRSLVRRVGSSGATEQLMLTERWHPVRAPAAGDQPRARIPAGDAGDAVLALGLTTPPDTLVFDLRVFRVGPDGAPTPFVARPVPGPETGTSLWLPDLVQATDGSAWPAGPYLLEALAGPTIVRLAIVVPGEPTSTAPPDRAPPPASDVVGRIDHWIALGANIDRLDDAPLVSDRDLGGSDGDGTCGGTARITPFDPLIGILHPAGRRVTSVRLFPVDTIRRVDIDVRFASDPVSGITVVALPGDGVAARQYSLVTDTVDGSGRGRVTYTVCVR